ncbi:MAG: DUF2500 domain-containing protein [Gudongella sp.]|nr:DUF2500 domain-containing protein [Gudongella sp.]
MDAFNIISMVFFLFPFLFFVFFVVVVIRIIKSFSHLNTSTRQPTLNVNARVVGKREDYRRFSKGNRSHPLDTGRSIYFVTFEFDSGDRLEFRVSREEYELMYEGDEGILVFQGIIFHSFDRYSDYNGRDGR